MSSSFRKPIRIRGRRTVITKSMIEESQKNTRSAMEAARWLDTSYNTYKKYAKIYGIFEQHLNKEGFGIKKGFGKYRIPVDDVITGKRQPPKRWSHKVLKKRLIEDGYFNDECGNCSYNEENMGTNSVCLGIDFKDGNHENFKIDNLRLLCPNCYLSYNGRFSSSKIFCK